MTAFFLEAGFLGIMLFGWNKVGPKAHFGATLMVAIGTLISTFWILASNSWMQTPQGFRIEGDHVVPVDWFKIIFNPSFPYRLAHMAIAAFIVAGLVVAASGAWHLAEGPPDPAIKKMFSMALWLLLVLTPIQAVRRRPARSQHARVSAGEDRGDRRSVGNRERRHRAEPVRHP